LRKKNGLFQERHLFMTRTIRHIGFQDKWAHLFSPALLQKLLPNEWIAEILTQCDAWEKRERKLSMIVVVWMLILLALFPRMGVKRVLVRLLHPFGLLDETGAQKGWTESAWRARRDQLPVKVFQMLFARLAHPIASPDTPGAFWRGYRLMAIDSTLEDVADTPANVAFFGRMTSGTSQSPFPQVRGTYLVECGTHTLVDATCTPCRVSEMTMARRLTRSLRKGMLVLLDRGFCASQLYHLMRQEAAELLARVGSHVLKTPEVVLSDGTYLATLCKGRNCRGKPIQLRVIEYTITLQGMKDSDKRHRLVTSLLDPVTAPAEELILLYHERWEVESTILEIDRQQAILHQPLRGKTPSRVHQEMYAILIAHNLVRALLVQAAMLPGEAPLAPIRLSYTQAITQVQEVIGDSVLLAEQEHPGLLARLLTALRKTRLPERRKTVRWYPRVVKRLYSAFPPKRSHHVGIARSDITWQSILSLSA
jgi:hypothetical protein